MNRDKLAKVNNIFLILLSVGVAGAACRGLVRENLSDFHLFRGQHLEESQSHRSAIKAFESAAHWAQGQGPQWLFGDDKPDQSAKALLQAGVVLEDHLEDLEQAQDYYKRGRDASPKSKAGKEAASRLSKLVARMERSKSKRAEGLRHMRRGNYRGAQASFEKVLRDDPGDREARHLLKLSMASARSRLPKGQAAELLHLALRAQGLDGARVQFSPYWSHPHAKYREALILDMPQGRRESTDLILRSAHEAAKILDQDLSFDWGQLVIRRHPGHHLRPPNFSAFRTDEIHDVSTEILAKFHRGGLTDRELLHRLAPGNLI